MDDSHKHTLQINSYSYTHFENIIIIKKQNKYKNVYCSVHKCGKHAISCILHYKYCYISIYIESYNI